MLDETQKARVRELIRAHVASPSLRHVRDGAMVERLVDAIGKALERHDPVWQKWSEPRETLARPAAYCWVPVEDLRDQLNRMDGPRLSLTDVTQRLRAFNEAP
jgi:hypothetical protein